MRSTLCYVYRDETALMVGDIRTLYGICVCVCTSADGGGTVTVVVD